MQQWHWHLKNIFNEYVLLPFFFSDKKLSLKEGNLSLFFSFLQCTVIIITFLYPNYKRRNRTINSKDVIFHIVLVCGSTGLTPTGLLVSVKAIFKSETSGLPNQICIRYMQYWEYYTWSARHLYTNTYTQSSKRITYLYWNVLVNLVVHP